MKVYILWVNAGDDCWLVGAFSTVEKVLKRAEGYKAEGSEYWRDLSFTEVDLDGLAKPDPLKNYVYVEWQGERAILKGTRESAGR